MPIPISFKAVAKWNTSNIEKLLSCMCGRQFINSCIFSAKFVNKNLII